MLYRQANPFLERMSERTISDTEFIHMFSPDILEKLPDSILDKGPLVFRSPPGAGKTTLLRIFTPAVLRNIWHARKSDSLKDAYRRLSTLNIINEKEGPQLLGVYMSCASGYADLPAGATFQYDGLFRALLNCRIVLQTIRSLAALIGGNIDQLQNIKIEYDEICRDLKMIPPLNNASELIQWAEKSERQVYSHLNSFNYQESDQSQFHPRLEGLLWLQGVSFKRDGKKIATQNLLMIDDLHKLRRKQRELLIVELTELRITLPVWLAMRNIAFEELLSPGARQGRDIRDIDLVDDIWGARQQQFLNYAVNILDRRMHRQTAVPTGSFGQHLRLNFDNEEVKETIQKGIKKIKDKIEPYKSSTQYTEWLQKADILLENQDVESLRELFVILILIARQEGKRQLSLILEPLNISELEDMSNKVSSAADIFIHEELGIPYYYGMGRLCSLATFNVEELLSMAANLYEGLKIKQILQKEPTLSPGEQEKFILEIAKQKRDFIPKSHTEGTRAQNLIDGIAAFCRSRTFLPNAPYVPGVTGVRLRKVDMDSLKNTNKYGKDGEKLYAVLLECVAENLLKITDSEASGSSREAGWIFYLNRSICALNGLPLGYGGWQDTTIANMITWVQKGPVVSRKKQLSLS